MSMGSTNYIGARVSIEMKGGMGYFQGTVTSIDGDNQQIRLNTIIHNGRPNNVKEMTFSAEHIKDLEVLEMNDSGLSSTAPGDSAPVAQQQQQDTAGAAIPRRNISPIDYLCADFQSPAINDKSVVTAYTTPTPVGRAQSPVTAFDLINVAADAGPAATSSKSAASQTVDACADPIKDFLQRTGGIGSTPIKSTLGSTKSLPITTGLINKDAAASVVASVQHASYKKFLKNVIGREFENNVIKKKSLLPTSASMDVVPKTASRDNPQSSGSKSDSNFSSPQHSRGYNSNNSNNQHHHGVTKQQNSRQKREELQRQKYTSFGSNGDLPYNGRTTRGEQQRQKNFSTFGSGFTDTDMNEDFDFVENNKLYDKQAVAAEYTQILQEIPQPDVVSQTEQCNPETSNKPSSHQLQLPVVNKQTVGAGSQQQAPPTTITLEQQRQFQDSEYQVEAKYRHDQNILGNSSNDTKQVISLPTDEPAETVYATDMGFLVPGLSAALHQRLLSAATQLGFTLTRQHETTARAAAELCMQLLGGERRLNSKNCHQVPRVVVLCGIHKQGSLGLNTARQLQTHDLLTTVLTPCSVSSSPPLTYTQELNLYNLTHGAVLHSTSHLDTSSAIDLILDARLDHKGVSGFGSEENTQWLSEVTSWASKQRCPVIGLDPPSYEYNTRNLSLPARALVVPGLPLVYSEQQGLVHLVKLALPNTVYQDLGIGYSSPFRAKFVVTLHRCD
uniref:Enhancer of mRNA-decapping protein 3 n=2 Tax=Hirondellea gigas TaxID=1518452 RepID=A0A2P2I6Q4_9CRUS